MQMWAGRAPVLVQMWVGGPESRCRCGWGEPPSRCRYGQGEPKSPGADVGKTSRVPVQMWKGAHRSLESACAGAGGEQILPASTTHDRRQQR